MRTQAYSIIEGLVGIAITRIAAGSETWAHGSGADKRPPTDPAEGKRKLDERAGRFTAYLREHGRNDVASLYLKDLEAGERWREEAMTASQRLVLVQNRVLGMWRSGALNAMGGVVVAGADEAEA